MREGKIVENGPPGAGTIPDPRRFVYIEACGVVGGAALTFEVGVHDTWVPSDRGLPDYRIVRDGCFRVAVPVSSSVTSRDVRRLRVIAHSGPAQGDAAGRSTRTVHLERINTVFMLDDQYRPGPPILQRAGSASIDVGGPAFEITVP
jgi:hypothetical protein